MTYKTKQENFWASAAGNEYAQLPRHSSGDARHIAFFTPIIKRMQGVKSVMEYGANRGQNISAIKRLLPHSSLYGVEINQKAYAELRVIDDVIAYNQSLLDFKPSRTYDFVFTKGVLIHINPDELPQAYQLLYKSSAKYICIAEYYNPTPISVDYRGGKELLFKRDFGGEMLDAYPDLTLLDYGFTYHRDPVFPQDDITWFLLKKQ
jgi:pseudaminic acid biosynthesis-associated methylase